MHGVCIPQAPLIRGNKMVATQQAAQKGFNVVPTAHGQKGHVPVAQRQWAQGSRLAFVMYFLANGGITFNANSPYLLVFGGTPTNAKQIANDARARGWQVKAHASGVGSAKTYTYKGTPGPAATHPIPKTPFLAGHTANGQVVA